MPRKLSLDNPSSSSYNRISQISQHLSPSTGTNTANSTSSHNQTRPLATMSSQPEHPTLLIPGPIEFDDAVLNSMSHYRYAAHCPLDAASNS